MLAFILLFDILNNIVYDKMQICKSLETIIISGIWQFFVIKTTGGRVMNKYRTNGFSIKISYCIVAILFVMFSLLFWLQAI